MTERRIPRKRYMPVTHLLLDKLMQDKRLTATDFRIVLWVARQSFGQWRKTGPGRSDGVRPEWVPGATGYRIGAEIGLDRRSVNRRLARLLEIGILARREDGALGVDEHYETGTARPLPDRDRQTPKAGPSAPGFEGDRGTARPRGGDRQPPKRGTARPRKRDRQPPTDPGKPKAPRALQEPPERRERERFTEKTQTRATGNGAPKEPKTARKPPGGWSRIGEEKPDPWRSVSDQRRRELEPNATKIIDAIEGKLDGFRPGQWWGRGLNLGRWAPAMIEALLALGKAIEKGKPPDNPNAFLETLYREKEADLHGDAAVETSREKLRAGGRRDEALR